MIDDETTVPRQQAGLALWLALFTPLLNAGPCCRFRGYSPEKHTKGCTGVTISALQFVELRRFSCLLPRVMGTRCQASTRACGTTWLLGKSR